MAPVNIVTTNVETLTLEAAKAIAEACEEKARSIKVPMNVAITDHATHLLHFGRMDGAKLTSISLAIDKAFTAAGNRIGTHHYKEAVWPGGPAFGIGHSNGNRFTTIGGGLPIIKDGNVIGAVGCSGGTPAEDKQVADAGVEAIRKLFKPRHSLLSKL
jgi:uncharacterized protein GlcG (DUF336 family)